MSQINTSVEKIALQTDKTSYLAGEILWFKCALTSRNNIDSILSSIAYLEFVNDKGRSILQGKIEIVSNTGNGNFYLPINLPTGVYTLVAYTSQLKNAGPSQFAYKKITVINTFTNIHSNTQNNQITNASTLSITPPTEDRKSINVSTNKKIYTIRSQFEVSISQPDLKNDNLLNGSISIAYVPDSSNTTENYLSINTPSNIENNNREYLAEYDGHIITAKVTSKWNQQPAANVNCALSIPSSVPFGFYTGVSDNNGIVRFNVKRYFGAGDVIIKAYPTENPESYSFELISPFLDSTSLPHYTSVINSNEKDSADLTRRSVAMQAENIYYQDSLNNFQLPDFKDTLPFFGKAEYSYMLDDYKRFTTMEEVLREYVTNINVQLRNSKLRMTIYDEKDARTYDNAILVLLDGVPLYNYNNIFNYDPLNIKKLDVVPRRYLIGSSVYNGIASFETYNPKFDGFDIDNTATAVNYDGLQLQRKFYSPVYTEESKGNMRLPDLRTTLLWEPSITLKNNETIIIKGFTSDFKGKYKVIVEGVSTKGEHFYGETTFEVN